MFAALARFFSSINLAAPDEPFNREASEVPSTETQPGFKRSAAAELFGVLSGEASEELSTGVRPPLDLSAYADELDPYDYETSEVMSTTTRPDSGLSAS